jgi:hypothetical protein
LLAKAAVDPGTGPISPSKCTEGLEIIAIPAGTGLMPGAVWVNPLAPSKDENRRNPEKTLRNMRDEL